MSVKAPKVQPVKNNEKKNVPKQKKKKRTRQQRRNIAGKKQGMSLTTPVWALVKGNAVLDTINVDVNYDPVSFYSIPLAFVTLGLINGGKDPYAAYKQFYSDIQSIATGGPGTAPARLSFYNDILGVLAPKVVPMGTTGVISYNVVPGPPVASPSNSITFSGGYEYYMLIPSNNVVSGWSTQQDGPSYTPEQISQTYLNYCEILSQKQGHLRLLRNVQLTEAYLKDISAFLRNSPYFGEGAGQVGGPFSSVEGEVPFRSKYFGVLIPFQPTMPRSSRLLDYTTGDPLSNFGLGLWNDFPTNYYQGAVTPTYKFLDLDEVLNTMMQIWQEAVIQYINDNLTSVTDTVAFLVAGMGVPWSTFRIMLRQQILWIAAKSQGVAQTMSPETSTGGFQPFICSSNTYPANPIIQLQLPGCLVENIRMLNICNWPYITKNYTNARNRQIIIPVWGAFKNTVATNITVETTEGAFNMFQPEPSSSPNIFDGTYGSNVADFNNTTMLQEAAATWNFFMTTCNKYILGSTQLGGAGGAGSLLQFTRYVDFQAQDLELKPNHRIHFARAAPLLKPYIQKREIKKMVERTMSKGKTEKQETIAFESYYNPPNSTIYSEYTLAVSGVIPITDSHRQMFPQLILPVIEIVDGSLPSQSQYQTAVKELYVYVNSTVTSNLINNRAMEIASGIPNFVKGLAGENTEWSEFCSNKSKQNEGGFLGNLFSTVGSVVGMFSPEVGAVASGLGALANSAGI